MVLRCPFGSICVMKTSWKFNECILKSDGPGTCISGFKFGVIWGVSIYSMLIFGSVCLSFLVFGCWRSVGRMTWRKHLMLITKTFLGGKLLSQSFSKEHWKGCLCFGCNFMLEMRICAISLDVFQGARCSVLLVQVLESR